MRITRLLNWFTSGESVDITPTLFQEATFYYSYQIEKLWNDIPSVQYKHSSGTASVTYSGAGKVDFAVEGSGTASYHTLGDHADFSFGDGVTGINFSWQFWVNPDQFDKQRWLLAKRGATTTQMEYEVRVNTNRTLVIIFYSNLGNSNRIEKTTSLTISTAGNWSHICITFDASTNTPSCYINGVKDNAMVDTSAGTFVAMNNGTSSCVLGQQSWSGFGGTSAFDGKWCAPCMWRNKVLTQDEVDDLYNGGNGLAFDYNYNLIDHYESPMYVLESRDNWMVGSDNENLYWSNDAGKHWINKYVWGTQWTVGAPTYDKAPQNGFIFSDGTYLFGTARRLYRTTDQLQTVTEVTDIQDMNGDPYVFHTPVDPTRPGTYFRMAGPPLYYGTIDGVEVLMWINHGNVVGLNGAAPTVVWYTIDKGATVKAAFEFGQNPDFRDDGTTGGGNTGTLLGKASESMITRHGHMAIFRESNESYYVTCGDFADETHVLKFTYNTATDVWTKTNILTNISPASRWKLTGAGIVGDYLYFGADSTDIVDEAERGIHKTHFDTELPNQISERLWTSTDVLTYIVSVDNGWLYASGQYGIFDTKFISIAENGTGAVTEITVVGKATQDYLYRMSRAGKSPYGFVRVVLGAGSVQPPIKTIFYKP